MINTFNYTANTGFGITFPAKSILIESEDSMIVISPGNLDKDSSLINKLKDYEENKSLIFIGPNNFHHMYLPKMKELFPNAKFYGTKRASEQNNMKLEPVENFSHNEIDCILIEGHKKLKEFVFFHKKTSTLISTDLIFNMHHKMNFMTKLMLTLSGTKNKLAMSRVVTSSITDKAAFKSSLKKLVDMDIENIILNHGDNISPSDFKKVLTSFIDN